MSLNYGSMWSLTEITANCRRICGRFDIPIPDDVLRGIHPCDPMLLIAPKVRTPPNP